MSRKKAVISVYEGPVIEWRACVENYNYEVSEYGHVRRVRSARTASINRLMKMSMMSNGYGFYGLSDSGKVKLLSAHRLVASAFLGAPPTSGHQVAHGDGDRLNNHYSNLRWATVKENHADKKVHGTQPVGITHWNSKLNTTDIERIRDQCVAGADRRAIASQFQIHIQSVHRIRRGDSHA